MPAQVNLQSAGQQIKKKAGCLLPAPARRWGPRGWGGWRGRSAGSRTSPERTAASRRAGRLRRTACSRAAPPPCPASAASAPPAAPAPLLRSETLARTAAAAPPQTSSRLPPATGNKWRKSINRCQLLGLSVKSLIRYKCQTSGSIHKYEDLLQFPVYINYVFIVWRYHFKLLSMWQ